MSTYSPISTCPSCNAFTSLDDPHCKTCGVALGASGSDALTPLAELEPGDAFGNPFAIQKKTEHQYFPPEPPKTLFSIFSFSGRASRKEYWLTTLGLWVAAIVAIMAIAGITEMFRQTIDDDAAEGLSSLMMVGLMFFGYWIALATQCRRWHDLNMSGWYFFMGMIPVVGPIYVLINVGFTKGTHGRNRYGADPLRPRSVLDFDDEDDE